MKHTSRIPEATPSMLNSRSKRLPFLARTHVLATLPLPVVPQKPPTSLPSPVVPQQPSPSPSVIESMASIPTPLTTSTPALISLPTAVVELPPTEPITSIAPTSISSAPALNSLLTLVLEPPLSEPAALGPALSHLVALHATPTSRLPH